MSFSIWRQNDVKTTHHYSSISLSCDAQVMPLWCHRRSRESDCDAVWENPDPEHFFCHILSYINCNNSTPYIKFAFASFFTNTTISTLQYLLRYTLYTLPALRLHYSKRHGFHVLRSLSSCREEPGGTMVRCCSARFTAGTRHRFLKWEHWNQRSVLYTPIFSLV